MPRVFLVLSALALQAASVSDDLPQLRIRSARDDAAVRRQMLERHVRRE